MNRYFQIAIFALGIVGGLLFTSPAKLLAEDIAISADSETTKACGDLIKECFFYKDPERSGCFYSSAKHPFCDGSSLSALTLRRWSMSPKQVGGNEAPPPALLGPQLVDQKCLENFDNQWSSALVAGQLSADVMKQLTATLSSCNKEILPSLSRP